MHRHLPKASETLRREAPIPNNYKPFVQTNPKMHCFVTFWCFPSDPNSSAAAVTPTLRRTLALLGESNILLENVTLAMGISTFLKRPVCAPL